MHFPQTEGLAAILAAAEHGSLSAAAQELGVTHGAVSRRIQAIEHWLGAPVFERHGRGVRLTPLGTLFVKRVERSFAAIVSMADDVRAAQRANSVRLSVLPSVARLWLVQRLAHLQGDPADTEVHVQTDHRMLNLESRETDIAIRAGAGTWPGVRATLLFKDQLSLVAAPAVAARLTRRETEGVMHETILYDSDAADWRIWCRESGFKFRPLAGTRRFEDHDLVLAAAVAGIGVALIRQPLATDMLTTGVLTQIPGPLVSSMRGHYVVARHNEERPAVLRVVERLIELSERVSLRM